MENRIKEQLSLFADRMSTETLRANQLRLYFSSLAYVLVETLRRLGLAGTEWAEAQVDTIRLKLLKIAAQVRVTARRIWIRYPGVPLAERFRRGLDGAALLKNPQAKNVTPCRATEGYRAPEHSSKSSRGWLPDKKTNTEHRNKEK